jgi:CDP-diacylglycerol--glycerol-3-phosphate 3-phosphatidyltransferase
VLSVYTLKPRFQGLLRPLTKMLAHAGVTANAVTLFSGVLSIGFGLILAARPQSRTLLLLLPAVLLIRMALNAADGMLAREFGQKTNLGAYLNELTDVFSDAFLYLPFAYMPGFDPLWIGAAIVLSVIAEMAGTVAAMTGSSRRYDGPMGKSDRALVFGAVALWLGLGYSLAPWATYALPRLIVLLLVMTVLNRVRGGLAEVGSKCA